MFFALLFAACPQDIAVTKARIDNDSDGYTEDVDCNDARADINPEAEEVCDGIDNNCDEAVDADATDALTFFADTDGDGYGDPNAAQAACEQEQGFVEDNTDCDDGEAASFPGNPEVCDGLDNDCNGEIDDDAADFSEYYGDADGDGWGVSDDTTEACEAPAGYSAVSGDCDDGNEGIHPDADESDCTDPTDYNCDGSVGFADADGDGVPACEDCDDANAARSPLAEEECDELDLDEDCDGQSDDADSSTSASSQSTWYRDVDADGYSTGSGTNLVQCEQPTGYASASGDCDDYDSTVNPGASEVCDAFDADEDCDGLGDDDDPSTDAASYVDYYRDADSDAYGDSARKVSLCEAPANYVANDDDCDDADSDVNPGAAEVCDSADVDEDCDGLSDDDDSAVSGGNTYFADADGDGYGDASSTTSACSIPAGYVANDDDCDDSNSGINPGAAEICDALDADEDCDGDADDSDASASGKSTYYRDADADTYGSATYALSRCEMPSGYVANDDDCDDADADTFPGSAATESSTSCMNDDDGDGYGDTSVISGVSAGTDCDDAKAGVHPGAAESCATTYDDDCNGSSNDIGASGCTTWYSDADADGYGTSASECVCAATGTYTSLVSTDCNDSSASINPGATEVCDALNADEDCDTLADDFDTTASGKSTFYADSDADTYGSSASATTACDQPSGYADDSDDCDDTKSAVHPGATEVCSTTYDDDCDGLANEAGATGGSTYYADADADGYGSLTSSITGCSLPSGYAATSTDCDDSKAVVNPAATETCSTAYDDDCDGSINEASSTGCTTYYYDADADGYGVATSSQCLCTATGSYDSLYDTDCDDASTTDYPGATEICGNADDEDCDGTADDGCTTYGYSGDYDAEYASTGTTDADAMIYGEGSGDDYGQRVVSGFDLDNDGYDDTVVGADGYNYTSSYYGGFFRYDGMPSGTSSATTNDVAVRYGYSSSSSSFGDDVWAIEDFDSDGYDEVAVYYYSGSSENVFVYEGENLTSIGAYSTNRYTSVSATGPVASGGDESATSGNNEVLLGDWDYSSYEGEVLVEYYVATGFSTYASIIGEDAGDYAGHGVAGKDGNDTNGDGYDDIFVGAYGDDTLATDAGAAYVVEAPVTSTFDLSGAQVKVSGAGAGYRFGWNVWAPGDTDGDGHADMLVAAPNADDAGTDAGVISLFEDVNTDGSTKDNDAGDYEATILGPNAFDYIGYTQVALGDVNADGSLDILIGSPYFDPSSVSAAGTAWLIYGPLVGSYDLGSTSDYDAAFRGNETSDSCGSGVALGDLDADGFDDIIVGCENGDKEGYTERGTLYFFGGM